MAEAADQFGDFFPAQNQPDQWADFNPQTPKEARESQIPESFVHRLYMGLSLRNVAEAAAKGAKEGFGQSPIGENFLPHEEIRKAMDAGLFYDPGGGKAPKTWQLLTEAAIRAGASTADVVTRGIASAIYAGGEVAGEVTGDPKLRNEAINALNFRLMSGDVGTFSRFGPKLRSPLPQKVGGLPKAEDFSNAATVIADGAPDLAKTAESNLYDLWHDRGVTPGEASHDSHVDAFLKHRLNTPLIDITDHSGIRYVQNSPVPEGTPRSALAVTEDAALNTVLADRQTKAAIDNPAVNRANDVPYGAAPDAMGNGLNIDRRIPETLTIDGTTFDPADPLAVREFVERDTAEKLIAGGMERDAAHTVARAEYAERAEAAWYVSHGIDKSKADAALRPFIDEINHEAPANPPPNIYQRPADSRGPTLQDIHEDDANSIPAKEGEPARDRVVAERDRYAQEQPPEIKAGLEAAARQAGYETKPGEPIGEGGAGPSGPSEVVGGGGAAEHIAPGGAGGVEPGAIVEGGVNLGPEGVAIPRAGERPGEQARTAAAGYPSGEMIAQAKNILEREVAAPPAETAAAPPAGATAEAPARAAARRGPAFKDPDKYSLLEFLVKNGGLKPTAELVELYGGKLVNGKKVGGKSDYVPWFGNLFREDGKTLDRALEAVVGRNGYMHDEGAITGGVTQVTQEQLRDLIGEEVRGTKQYRLGQAPPAKKIDIDEQNHRLEGALDDYLKSIGNKPETMPAGLRNLALENMQKRGIHDPEVAWEDATQRFEDHAAETGKIEPVPERLPGWNEPLPNEPGATPQARGEATATGKQPAGAKAGEPARPIGGINREPIKETDDLAHLTDEDIKAFALSSDVTAIRAEAGRQLPTPVGRLVEAAQNSLSKLFDIGLDIQRMIAPMATGLKDAKRFAKDFENTLYRVRWEWWGADERLSKFPLESQKRMWNAADEESVLRQEMKGKPGLAAAQEHMGLTTLTPEERVAVEREQADGQMTWVQAREVGMVKGEGLPSYTPRMVINMAGAMGGEGAIPLNGLKLRVRTAQMMFRKHLTAEETEAAAKAKLGEGAEIVRNIRTLPWATARLKEAIATRHMINRLKELGDRTGSDLVAEGFQPDQTWWTDQNSPAFKTWSPKFVKDEATGKITAVKDEDGNQVFIQTPIYLRGDTEGPVRAVASVSKGPQSYAGSLYGALMALKGKAMQLIMYSPTVHNAVEWGRALPAMPGKVASFKVYFDGNRAKNNPAVMGDAIDHGMAPIGKRFFNQDITSMMEEPSLTPGRSFTSKVLGFVPGLFDPAYETAVRAAVDKLGDFRSNTLLWDRVADLQMGLYTNFKDEMIAKGQDPSTAAYMAAHWANRYAGSLPRSAMSEGARRFANLVWFSRSFTLGNLGVMKDAVGHLGPAIWNPLMEMLGRDDLRMDVTGGLPRAVLAQIETEGNKLMPSTVAFARNMAIRKAVSVVIADIGLYYIGNSVLQSVMNVIRGDSTASEEMRQYADRLIEAITKRVEHPLSLLQPFDFMGSLSATSENEPNKEGRIRVGTRADGTAVYARLTPGKIGEEFISWPTGPLDMAKRKESTFARPLWEIFANDKGFGRHVYDPYADTPLKYAKVGIDVAWHLTKAQVEQTSVGAAYDLLRGQGDWLTVAQLIGPWVGVTFSRGAPGGPAMGEYHRIHDEHQQQIMNEMPQIKEMIRNGNFIEAQQKMRELNLERGFQRSILRGPHLSARALREIHNSGTPQQILRFDRALEQQRQNSE